MLIKVHSIELLEAFFLTLTLSESSSLNISLSLEGGECCSQVVGMFIYHLKSSVQPCHGGNLLSEFCFTPSKLGYKEYSTRYTGLTCTKIGWQWKIMATIPPLSYS